MRRRRRSRRWCSPPTPKHFSPTHTIHEELFGPASLVVTGGPDALEQIASTLDGHLTATLHGTTADLEAHRPLVAILERKVGRLLFNGFPTGVEVAHAMQHGGPYPATTDARTTSVGTAAIERFVRPICYQDFPQASLPEELRGRKLAERLANGGWRMDAGVVRNPKSESPKSESNPKGCRAGFIPKSLKVRGG